MPDPSPDPDPSSLDPSPDLDPSPVLHSTLLERGEHYLGDGLYASFDGFNIWLRAPRPDGDHRVAMEPGTLGEFLRWSAPIRRHFLGT